MIFFFWVIGKRPQPHFKVRQRRNTQKKKKISKRKTLWMSEKDEPADTNNEIAWEYENGNL